MLLAVCHRGEQFRSPWKWKCLRGIRGLGFAGFTRIDPHIARSAWLCQAVAMPSTDAFPGLAVDVTMCFSLHTAGLRLLSTCSSNDPRDSFRKVE